MTSKLDNKWKQLPRKLNSARAMSMVINQADNDNKKRERPSIAWATPGTAKAVAEELGDLDEIEESILETEEEEGDLDVTPVGETTFETDEAVMVCTKYVSCSYKTRNMSVKLVLRYIALNVACHKK